MMSIPGVWAGGNVAGGIDPDPDDLPSNSLFRFMSGYFGQPFWLRTNLEDSISSNGWGTYYYGFPEYPHPSAAMIFSVPGAAVYDGSSGDLLGFNGFIYSTALTIYPDLYPPGISLLSPGAVIKITGYISDIRSISSLTLQFYLVSADGGFTYYDDEDNYSPDGYMGGPSEILTDADATGFTILMTLPPEYEAGDGFGIHAASGYFYSASGGHGAPDPQYTCFITSVEVVD